MRRSPLSALGVSYRLAALVIISVVSLVAVGIGGWVGISQVAKSVTTLQDERLPAANLLGEIRSSTSTLLQYSFEVLSREKQVNAQSRFKQVLERKRLIANNLTQAMTAYENLPKSAEEAEAWKKFKDSMVPWRARNDELSAVLQTLSENDDFDKQAQLFGQYKQPLASWGFVQSSVDVNLTKLLSLNRAAAEQAREHDVAVQKLALRFIAVTLGLAVVVLLVLAIVIVRSITVPLGRLRHTIVSIANDNDFTRRADVRGRDEMGQTAEAFNRLLEGAHASLRDVLGNAESISSAAQRVAQASQQAAESSGNQSEASATMAAAIEQMTVSINHINDSMHEASGQAQEAGAAAKTGSDIILRSNAEIDTIAQAVQSTSQAIDHLSKESERISLILQVIKEVADQTNLLALNAAIEAARAGEQGRGFAVVADEVRKLAERTTHSTTEIASLIQSMQSSGHEAVRCMGLVDRQVGSGKALSSDAVDHIKGIYDHAMQVVSVISDVSAAIHEQSTTAQSIAREVESVARLTETGHVTASETAKVSQDLDVLAENLRVAVNRFKV